LLTITVCVGSSCYVRGSERLAEAMGGLVKERGLNACVELTGAFCMDQCSLGVSVRVNDRTYRCVDPDSVVTFFENEVMPCLQAPPA
jgi:NADH:ubiquinone oxidoreductase subunit E